MANEREEGLAALQRGDFQAAAEQLETATRLDPNDFQAHLYLGGVYHQLQRHADAARVLTRATELQPSSAQARYNLGVAQEQNGDLQGAQASFGQALGLQSDYSVAQEALDRVRARLQGPTSSGGSASAGGTGLYGETAGAPLYGDNAGSANAPAYGSGATGTSGYGMSSNSSFGGASAAPASPGGSEGAQSYTPPANPYNTPAPSNPTPGLADYGASAPGGNPPAYGQQPSYGQQPTYGQPAQPSYGQQQPGQAQPLDMAGNPMNMGQPSPYGQPGYAQPPTPYGQQPGYASPRQQPYGQPAPYGQPGQQPGYAPPGSYGYGNAPQYVVPQQPCKEAKDALVMSIVGIFCFGIILEPIAIYKALQAKKMMQADPNLTGQSEATIALIIAGIILSVNVLMWLLILLSMVGGVR